MEDEEEAERGRLQDLLASEEKCFCSPAVVSLLANPLHLVYPKSGICETADQFPNLQERELWLLAGIKQINFTKIYVVHIY